MVNGRWSGEVSQSLQLAPFDANYEIYNTSSDVQIHDTVNVFRNTYLGGSYQQAASWIAVTPDAAYELTSRQFASYGEYFFAIVWGGECIPRLQVWGTGFPIDRES